MIVVTACFAAVHQLIRYLATALFNI